MDASNTMMMNLNCYKLHPFFRPNSWNRYRYHYHYNQYTVQQVDATSSTGTN